MAGLDTIKHYSDGETVSSDSGATPSGATPSGTTPSGGTYYTTGPKSTGIVDKIALDSNETKEILARMQEFIDQRQSPLSLLMGGLNRAYATTYGPSAALEYQKQQEAEDKQVMDYRAQMAAYRAAQTQAELKSKGLQNWLSGGAGGASGAGGAGVGLNSLTPEAQKAFHLAHSDDEKRKIITEDLKMQAQGRTKHQYDPGSLDRKPVMILDPQTREPRMEKLNMFEYQNMLAAGLIYNPAEAYKQFAQGAPAQGAPAQGAPAQGAPAQPLAPISERMKPDARGFIPSEGNAAALAAAMDLPLISGDRDFAKQAQLKMASQQPGYKGPPVAEPGTSQHQFGNAIDVDTKSLTPEQLSMLKKAGFVQPYPNSPNHWELASAPAISKPTDTAAVAPVRTAARPGAVSPSTMMREMEAADIASKSAAEKRGVSAEKLRDEFEIDINPALIADNDAMAKRMQRIVIDNPELSGVINKADYVSAVAGVLQKGIGNFGIGDLENAIFKTLPETTQKSIGRRSELITYLARIELYAAKIIKGQGQITEGEREILQRASASISDPAELIYKKARILERANKKNQELAAIYGSGENFNDFRKFNQDPRFVKIMEKYRNDLEDIMNEEVDFRKLKTGVAAAKGPSHPADIQAIINRNKPKKAE